MKREIKSLTGIRGLAAAIITVYHLSQNAAFNEFSSHLIQKGYLCVDLFFVLSGFILTYIYGNEETNKRTFDEYLYFLKNRVARILPLHTIVTLFFFFRFTINISNEGNNFITYHDLIWNALLLQGWGIGVFAIAGNSWSVSTEMLAYILFPLMLLFSRSKYVLLMALLSAVTLITISFLNVGSEGPLDVYSGTRGDLSPLPLMRCLSGFALGIIAFNLCSSQFAQRYLSSNLALISALALMALLLMYPETDAFVVFLFPIIIINLFFESKLSIRIFANPPIVHLGVISYSLYLWHPLVRDIVGRVASVCNAKNMGIPDFYFIIAALFISWAVSLASYNLIEVTGRKYIRALFSPRAPE